MPKPLNFEAVVDTHGSEERQSRYVEGKRWPSRKIDQQVQMSLRMAESAYDQFRELCKNERRTNGDMLKVLMESYLKKSR